MDAPTMADFSLLKRILRYIKGTVDMGMHIGRNKELTLSAYYDSDYAGCKETRRSMTGLCILMGSNLVSWSAKDSRLSPSLQRRLTWILFILRDFGITPFEPTLLQCDNLSAVYLSANPALHNKSKHFDTYFHYIREQVALGLIETSHIPAKLQLADIFTKSLPRSAFEELRNKLGVGRRSTPSLQGDVSEAMKSVGQTSTRKEEEQSPRKPIKLLPQNKQTKEKKKKQKTFNAEKIGSIRWLCNKMLHLFTAV
ncbi:unnamed protein product [Microthlaspi erraticum]|uniref:Reverse transcriptase Ty1/copia-type domain-containing protein n=1 Tax=Microthlaspi erraticum TaxID=1685480 RepID=A0A6D2HZW4_9BRAS|nr:unnamed protein product [Microthlaspi erraticum]